MTSFEDALEHGDFYKRRMAGHHGYPDARWCGLMQEGLQCNLHQNNLKRFNVLVTVWAGGVGGYPFAEEQFPLCLLPKAAMAAGQLTDQEREDRTLILVHLVASRLMPHIQVLVITARLKAGLAPPQYQDLAGTLQGKFVGLREEPSFNYTTFMNDFFPDAEQLCEGGTAKGLSDSPMSPQTPRPPQGSDCEPPQTRQRLA